MMVLPFYDFHVLLFALSSINPSYMNFQNSSAYHYLQINAEKIQYWTLNLVEKNRSYSKKQKSAKIKDTDCISNTLFPYLQLWQYFIIGHQSFVILAIKQ